MQKIAVQLHLVGAGWPPKSQSSTTKFVSTLTCENTSGTRKAWLRLRRSLGLKVNCQEVKQKFVVLSRTTKTRAKARQRAPDLSSKPHSANVRLFSPQTSIKCRRRQANRGKIDLNFNFDLWLFSVSSNLKKSQLPVFPAHLNVDVSGPYSLVHCAQGALILQHHAIYLIHYQPPNVSHSSIPASTQYSVSLTVRES